LVRYRCVRDCRLPGGWFGRFQASWPRVMCWLGS
jgi:hypothetical protein